MAAPPLPFLIDVIWTCVPTEWRGVQRDCNRTGDSRGATRADHSYWTGEVGHPRSEPVHLANRRFYRMAATTTLTHHCSPVILLLPEVRQLQDGPSCHRLTLHSHQMDISRTTSPDSLCELPPKRRTPYNQCPGDSTWSTAILATSFAPALNTGFVDHHPTSAQDTQSISQSSTTPSTQLQTCPSSSNASLNSAKMALLSFNTT